MSSDSPLSILFSTLGIEASIADGYTIPVNTPGFISLGSDGTVARYLKADSSGRQVLVGAGTAGSPTGGVLSIQGVTSGTPVIVSSSTLALDATLAKLTISPSTALGSNTLAMVGGSVTTSAPSYTNGNINPLSLTTSGLLRVDGSGATQPVSGTVTANAGTGSFTVAQATAANLNATVVQSTAANLRSQTASESSTAATTGSVASLTGGAVTTSAPSYTTGQMNPLSLTTAGALRVDGSAVTQPVSGTFWQTTQPVSGTVAATQSGTWNITNISGTVSLPTGAATESSLAKLTVAQGASLGSNTQALIGASVTTSAPTYTTGQISPLSLDTSGALRVNVTTGGGTNASVSSTGSSPPGSATYIGGSVTTSAPTYTNGQMSGLSLTTTGALRVDNSGVTQPVSGTVAATQSGTWTVQPGNTANTTPWLASISQGGNTATVSASNALKVDGSAVTQPVSGTITANIGTSGSLALDATVAKLTVAQSTALGSNTQTMVGGSVTTSAPSYTTGNINPLSLTTAGALRVDNSAVTQPVSGTFWQATQPVSGTITVTQSTAGNLNATVTGTVAATQSGTWNINNVSGTVSLPTGASTEASLAKLTVAQGTALGSNTQAMVGGSVTTSAPTYTTGQISPLSLDTSGALRVNVTAGGGANASVSSTGSAPPASATYIGGSVTTSVPTYTNGQMSALSLTTAGLLRVDNSGVTQPVSGTVAATQSGTWTVQPGNTANTTPWLASISQGGNTATVSASNALKVDGSAVTQPVSGTFWQATQPVSGTVTANIGTSGSLALDATIAKLTIAQSTALGSNTQALMGGSVTTSAPSYTTGNINPLSLTTAGALRVDASATTQPVSGTVTANAGTGSFTVAQATAANLNATVVGTTAAGSGASSGLITVQGNASGTPIPVSGTVTAANASVSSTGASPPASATYIGGSVTTAAPSYTNGQMSALSLTTAGLLRTDNSGVTQPVSGTVTVAQATAGNLNATVTGTVAATQSGTWNINNISGTVSLPTGAAAESSLAKLTIAQGTALGSNTQAMVGGSVTTSAPTYTTGQISPLSLTTGGALRINGIEAQGPGIAATPTTTSVAASTSATTLLSANSARIGATVYNDSTAIMYLKLGTSPSTTSYTVQLVAGGYYETPFGYVGAITAVWASATGNSRICEITA